MFFGKVARAVCNLCFVFSESADNRRLRGSTPITPTPDLFFLRVPQRTISGWVRKQGKIELTSRIAHSPRIVILLQCLRPKFESRLSIFGPS